MSSAQSAKVTCAKCRGTCAGCKVTCSKCRGTCGIQSDLRRPHRDLRELHRPLRGLQSDLRRLQKQLRSMQRDLGRRPTVSMCLFALLPSSRRYSCSMDRFSSCVEQGQRRSLNKKRQRNNHGVASFQGFSRRHGHGTASFQGRHRRHGGKSTSFRLRSRGKNPAASRFMVVPAVTTIPQHRSNPFPAGRGMKRRRSMVVAAVTDME
jgi:hypothetical protein